jgi:hypothetical protein
LIIDAKSGRAVRVRKTSGDYRMLEWFTAGAEIVVATHGPFDMTFTLVVPGLLARTAETLSAMPAFRALARYAAAPHTTRDGLAAAIVAAMSLPRETPVAPLSALGAGMDLGDDYVLAATPVTLVAGRDNVLLAGRIDDLDRDDAVALIALLNRHFAADAIAFAAPRPSTWFVRSGKTPALHTSPLDAALGRAIYRHLPRGADATTWQRWQDEIQMLLYDHAVNQAREAQGKAPFTGVWLWGGGRLADVALPPVGRRFAAAGAPGDIVRGFAILAGQAADALPPDFSATMLGMERNVDVVVSLAPVYSDDDVRQFATAWLQPAVMALEHGDIDALQLVADGQGAAATWRAERSSPFARLASRWRAPGFSVPTADEE